MQNWLGVVVKVALTALILGFFLFHLDVRAIGRSLASVNGWAAVGAFFVVLAQTLFAAKRLNLVVNRFGVPIPFANAFRITLEGMFFSHTFLSFIGGDALRIWRIRKAGLPLIDATSAILIDRLIGILVNHICLLASLPWLLSRISERSVSYALILLAVAGVAGFAVILFLGSLRGRGGYLHELRERLPVKRVATLLIEASTVGRYFLTYYPQLLQVGLVSVFIALGNALAFGIILLGMGVDAPLALGCALLVPAVLEIAMVPISIAGWGLREGAAVVAFGALGLQSDVAFGSSLAYGLIVGGVSLLGGIIWVADRKPKPV
jgi:uncharacterized protein (TIRG00374 family)